MASHRSTGNAVKFSPLQDSLFAVTGYEAKRGCLNIYSSTQSPLNPFSRVTDEFQYLNDCSWSLSNPNLIILAANEGGSHLIDISRHSNPLINSFYRHNTAITTSVDWNPNGDSFLSASNDGNVNQWFIDQSDCEYTYGHPRTVSRATWNPRDPTCIASTCADGTLRIWDIRDVKDGIVIRADDAALFHCDWNWHGRTCIATASHGRNYIRVWDIRQTRIPIKVLLGAHTDGVRRVKFSPHREYQIASASDDFKVAVWDYGAEEADPIIERYGHHTARVLGLDMSRRVEGLLASCGEDGLVHVWQHALPEARRMEFKN